MSDSRLYSRIYFEVMDDPKFDGVREDVAHFGTWALLLLVADMGWPASVFLPPVPPASVELLVERGLVSVLPGGRYRVRGLDKERSERTERARANAKQRQSSRSAAAQQPLSNGSANALLAKQSKAEQSKDETNAPVAFAEGADWDGRADLEAWLLVKRRIPTPKQREFLDAYVRTFDVTGPARAERLILGNPDDPIAALKADLDAFRQERLTAAKAADLPKPRPPRGLTGVNAELAAFLREQEATA